MNNVMEKQRNTATAQDSRQYGNAYYNAMPDYSAQYYNYNRAYQANAYAQRQYAPQQNYVQQPAYATSAQQYYRTAPYMAQQAYPDMQPYQMNYDARYAEAPEDMPVAAEYDSAESFGMGDSLSKEKKSKRSLNFKAKMLIALYFVIIAIVATLIFVNIGLSAGSATAEGEVSQYTESTTAYMKAPDGTLTSLDNAESVDYSYDTSTNWFDDFCDWVGKQVG